ncbi:hypothetical protein CLU86_2714 [Acidovorax sp. 62]|nr:hypothetical protein CLU86_2714 [Acidovorax sp. 62]
MPCSARVLERQKARSFHSGPFVFLRGMGTVPHANYAATASGKGSATLPPTVPGFARAAV